MQFLKSFIIGMVMSYSIILYLALPTIMDENRQIIDGDFTNYAVLTPLIFGLIHVIYDLTVGAYIQNPTVRFSLLGFIIGTVISIIFKITEVTYFLYGGNDGSALVLVSYPIFYALVYSQIVQKMYKL